MGHHTESAKEMVALRDRVILYAINQDTDHVSYRALRHVLHVFYLPIPHPLKWNTKSLNLLKPLTLPFIAFLSEVNSFQIVYRKSTGSV